MEATIKNAHNGLKSFCENIENQSPNAPAAGEYRVVGCGSVDFRITTDTGAVIVIPTAVIFAARRDGGPTTAISAQLFGQRFIELLDGTEREFKSPFYKIPVRNLGEWAQSQGKLPWEKKAIIRVTAEKVMRAGFNGRKPFRQRICVVTADAPVVEAAQQGAK